MLLGSTISKLTISEFGSRFLNSGPRQYWCHHVALHRSVTTRGVNYERKSCTFRFSIIWWDQKLDYKSVVAINSAILINWNCKGTIDEWAHIRMYVKKAAFFTGVLSWLVKIRDVVNKSKKVFDLQVFIFRLIHHFLPPTQPTMRTVVQRKKACGTFPSRESISPCVYILPTTKALPATDNSCRRTPYAPPCCRYAQTSIISCLAYRRPRHEGRSKHFLNITA